MSEEIFVAPITGATVTFAATRCDCCRVRPGYQLTAPDGRYFVVCVTCCCAVIATRVRNHADRRHQEKFGSKI